MNERTHEILRDEFAIGFVKFINETDSFHHGEDAFHFDGEWHTHEEFLEIYKNSKKTSQEQINSIIDVLNTQGSISEGDMPVLIDNDCTCDKCGKESRGSRSCPFDEEFNGGYSDSCNCCDSCRRECLMDI